MNLLLKKLESIGFYTQIQLFDIKTSNIRYLLNVKDVIYYRLNGITLNRYMPYNYQRMGGITLYKHGNADRLSTYKLPLYVQHSPPVFDRISADLTALISDRLLMPYFTMFYIKEIPYIIGNSMIINEIQGKAVLSILYDTVSTASYLYYNNKNEFNNKCILGLNTTDYHYPLEAYLKKNIQEFANSNSFDSIIFSKIYVCAFPQSKNISYSVASRNIVLNILLKRASNYLCNYVEASKVYDENGYTKNHDLAKSIKNYLFDLVGTYDRADKYANDLPPISLERSKRDL